VDGLNSQWFNSGDLLIGGDDLSSITGRLEVANGGQVQADAVSIGQAGNGTLNITSGGRVDSQTSTLGLFSGSTGSVTVAGDGSLWNNTAATTVGSEGDGTLLITDGGKVTTGSDASVGHRLGSTGTVTVSSTIAGAGSVWEIGGRLALSFSPDPFTSEGAGTVRIQPGGKVNVGQDTVVSAGDLLSLEGGTFTTSQISFQKGGSAGANFEWTSGTLHVGVFQGNLVNSAGVLSPGSSIGVTTIVGNYNQLADATLQIEIGGTAAVTQHDFVGVNENAFLGGDLELVLVNSFVPSSIDTFTILDAGLNLFGTFANVTNGQRLTTTEGLGSFVVNYGAGSLFDASQIVLSSFLAAGLPGDYNLDDVVDAADYTVWRNNLGSLTALPNDNTPGVDAGDYDRWKTHFGETAGSGASASVNAASVNAAVPEPSALVLFAGTLIALAMLRRD
jgi:T5SS/PEP-CTERM-associated repeat protein